jgi:hypothetical protein
MPFSMIYFGPHQLTHHFLITPYKSVRLIITLSINLLFLRCAPEGVLKEETGGENIWSHIAIHSH